MLIFFLGILLLVYGVLSKKYSVGVGMLFVFLIMGFQEGVPGDYQEYRHLFEGGGASAGDITVKEGEFSYIWLTQALSGLVSFHFFVLLTSFLQCLAIGLMIKDYAPQKYHSFGVLLVYYCFFIMMIQMKAMRQGYAVDTMLLAYWLLGKRFIILSIISIVISYGFHNSIIVAIPFYIFLLILLVYTRKIKVKKELIGGGVNDTKSKKCTILAATVAIGLFFFYLFKFYIIDAYINPYLESLDFFAYGAYTQLFDMDKAVSWWILFYHIVITFLVSLYYLKENDLFLKFCAIMVIVANYVTIGLSGFGDIQRVKIYFVIFIILVFPNVAAMIRNNYGKKKAFIFIFLNLAFVMLRSVRAMLSSDYSDGNGFASYTFSFFNW